MVSVAGRSWFTLYTVRTLLWCTVYVFHVTRIPQEYCTPHVGESVLNTQRTSKINWYFKPSVVPTDSTDYIGLNVYYGMAVQYKDPARPRRNATLPLFQLFKEANFLDVGYRSPSGESLDEFPLTMVSFAFRIYGAIPILFDQI